MRRLWGVLAAELILVFFLCFGCAGFESLAAGDGGMSWQDENAQAEAAVSANVSAELARYDFSGIDQYLSRHRLNQDGGITFSALVEMMLSGQWEDAAGQALRIVKDKLFAEIDTGTRLMGQILILGIIGAFFSNFSSIFSGSQISETGFYVTYLLVFAFLASGFLAGIGIAEELLRGILEFMKALVPAYFLAVAVSGGSLTSVALYQFTLGVIALLEWIFPALLLPLIRVDILLVMAGHMMKENIFSRFTDLLTNIIKWSMKTILGLVLGFQLIQGMVLPFADSMKATALIRTASLIPGIGQGAASVSQILLGSGVLIKNAMGAAAVVILIAISILPVIKLFVLMVLCQGAAALMQPVCDKRLVSCISEVGTGTVCCLSCRSPRCFSLSCPWPSSAWGPTRPIIRGESVEGLYDWVRNIACYLIFMTVLANVLPSGKYEKYMRLFAGMVLLLLVLKPLTGGLRIEERIAYYYKNISFAQEVETLKEESSRLEEERKERMFSQYREGLAADVARLAESAGFAVRDVRVELEEDGESGRLGAVNRVWLTVARQTAGREDAAEGSSAAEGDGIRPVEIGVDRIEVTDESASPYARWELDERLFEGQEVNRLRRQIAGYYALEERYVEIEVEDE